MKMETKFKCVICGKLTAGRLPQGGDASVWFPRRHKGEDGNPCPGNIKEAKCLNVESAKRS